MTSFTTEGSARAWVGVATVLLGTCGVKTTELDACCNIAKAPSRGEGRALSGGAVRGVL